MSTSKDRFLRNFFMAALLTLRVFPRNLLRGIRRKKIVVFYFVLMSDLIYERVL